MTFRNRSILFYVGFIIALGSLCLLPPSAMGYEGYAGLNAESSMQTVPEATASEFSLGALLGDPHKESLAKRTVVRWVGLVAPIVGASLYGIIAYGGEGRFHFSDDGFFLNEDRYEGGADKVGHAFVSYATHRFLTNWIFEYSESTHLRAMTYATISTALLAFAVEVVDGFYFYDGFSREDLVANAAGIVFANILELIPPLDRLLGFSLTYWPTSDLQDGLIETDYNGYKYFLNIKMSGIPYIQDTFLQYVQIDFGFYIHKGGKRPYEHETGSPDRHITFGVSLNISHIIQKIFHKHTVISTLGKAFEYYHVPAGYTFVDKIVRAGESRSSENPR